MLWFFHAGDAKYDPVYSMLSARANSCAHIPSVPSERADWLLSAELALTSARSSISTRGS